MKPSYKSNHVVRILECGHINRAVQLDTFTSDIRGRDDFWWTFHLTKKHPKRTSYEHCLGARLQTTSLIYKGLQLKQATYASVNTLLKTILYTRDVSKHEPFRLTVWRRNCVMQRLKPDRNRPYTTTFTFWLLYKWCWDKWLVGELIWNPNAVFSKRGVLQLCTKPRLSEYMFHF